MALWALQQTVHLERSRRASSLLERNGEEVRDGWRYEAETGQREIWRRKSGSIRTTRHAGPGARQQAAPGSAMTARRPLFANQARRRRRMLDRGNLARRAHRSCCKLKRSWTPTRRSPRAFRAGSSSAATNPKMLRRQATEKRWEPAARREVETIEQELIAKSAPLTIEKTRRCPSWLHPVRTCRPPGKGFDATLMRESLKLL
jgi:hypothetical protein